MPRFDWQLAIVNLAIQVEASLMTQRMFADCPEKCARMEKERDGLCRHAAWLARGYCRRGRKQARRAH